MCKLMYSNGRSRHENSKFYYAGRNNIHLTPIETFDPIYIAQSESIFKCATER